MENERRTVIVSGGFSLGPHCGHCKLILAAAEFGDVIVVLNSDEWLMRKQGHVPMPWSERAEIMMAIKGVIAVEKVEDMTDGTVCEALRRLKPTFFANGGDRMPGNTPEMKVCEELGITMLWGVGGGKIQSSSWLVNKIRTI